MKQCLEMSADSPRRKLRTAQIQEERAEKIFTTLAKINQVGKNVETGRVCGDKIHHPRANQPSHEASRGRRDLVTEQGSTALDGAEH